MLKMLTLKNLILVEEAHLYFEGGFTVVTGETGAGKTALIEAIRLILGERADTTKLRKGCEKALIQGVFELNPTAEIKALFTQAAVAYPQDEDLILTREINASGKGRAFVCGQIVPNVFLQKLASYLVDFIGQHAPITLKSPDTQRELLDLYGKIDPKPFQQLWKRELQLEANLKKIIEERRVSEERHALLQRHLEELEEANIQDNEEGSLFEEYELLANSHELLALTDQILERAETAVEKTFAIPPLLAKLSKYDSRLQEADAMAKEAHLNLSEIHSQIQSFQSRIENDPNRLNFLEERLKQLAQLKKKYGPNLIAARESFKKELLGLGSLEEQIQSISSALESAKRQVALASQALTKERKKTAVELEKTLSGSLQELNIPHAKLFIQINPCSRSFSGEDAIAFFLQANRGEKPVEVKDSLSGGELSRLLFSLKSALAEKTIPTTMIFDEIDANVGGETGTVIGGKLKELGTVRQVICITHFPQVARQSDHHLRVSKEEKGDRTICKIELLNQKTKEIELLRMLGGQKVY